MKRFDQLTAQNKQVVAGYYIRAFDYAATLDDGSPNPETAAQFFQRIQNEHIVRVALAQRAREAQAAAAITALSDADLA